MNALIINGVQWDIVPVGPVNDMLRRSDGVLTLGVTDLNELAIFINNALPPALYRKVLIHEITHAWMFSYGYRLTVAQEEFVCEFVANHAENIISKADEVLCMGVMRCVS